MMTAITSKVLKSEVDEPVVTSFICRKKSSPHSKVLNFSDSILRFGNNITRQKATAKI